MTILEVYGSAVTGIKYADTAVSATDADGDFLYYYLSGADAGLFDIRSGTDPDKQGSIYTRWNFDYESSTRWLPGETPWLPRETPVATDRSFSVTVTVKDCNCADALSDTIAVTINIGNIDEAGTVEITGTLVEGQTLSATVTDPDGAVTSPTWSWYNWGLAHTDWTAISGATSATYNIDDFVGQHLQVRVTYTDPLGASKTASAIAGIPTNNRADRFKYAARVGCDGVSFTDSTLSDAVKRSLGLGASDTVTGAQMASLRSLSIRNPSSALVDSGLDCAVNLTSLTLTGAGLTSARVFPDLRSLDLSDNSLTSVDLSLTKDLYSLNLSDNELTAISTDGLSDLRSLDAYRNEISTVSNLREENPNLRRIRLFDNKITKTGGSTFQFDVSGMAHLTGLDLSENSIRTVNVTGASSLGFLGVEDQDSDRDDDADDDITWVTVTGLDRSRTLVFQEDGSILRRTGGI